ncbi:MAG: DUF2157 domain-containing protein [Alphaproteobacteria bacterium]
MTQPANKQEAISEIIRLAKAFEICAEEISAGLIPAADKSIKSTGSVVTRVFGYLGGIFVLAGIGTYIAMFWPSMNSFTRVLVTFASGFACYILAVIAAKDKSSHARMVAPLLLIAALLQPTGLFVAIYEWFNSGSDERYAVLFVFGVIGIQQFFTFRALKHWILLFFTIAYGMIFTGTLMDLVDIPHVYTGLALGISLLCIAYSISKTPFHRTAGLWYFIGSALFLFNLFDWVERTPLEILYLAATGFMVYLSVLVQSTALLVVGILAMLSYIGYFTAQHFVQSVGWPITLIVIGGLFFAISTGGWKIKQKYFKK